eukprot:2822049-Amphidinium_carterae.1
MAPIIISLLQAFRILFAQCLFEFGGLKLRCALGNSFFQMFISNTVQTKVTVATALIPASGAFR